MSEKTRVLVVDDDPSLCRLLEMRLQTAGYQPATCESGERALAELEQEPADVVVADLKMGGMDGLALFDAIRGRWPTLPVIILTAHGSIPDAVEATRRGVHGFLTKPFDAEELLDLLEKAVNVTGGSESARESAQRHGIHTRSPRMEAELERALLVANSEANVLIRGASGTGKEVIARAIHNASQRAQGPFVAVNCGAIPETLLESELFGHVKGAFTGAERDREGLFREADGGTLFLDEIGDMPLQLQVKLLRALQEQVVRPLGGRDGVSVNVRVLSATHRDLDKALAEGEFREDLYFRLAVVGLELPSLAQRREDIPLLAKQFLSEANERHGREVRDLSPEALEMLSQAEWPGNIRQLQNVIEQCVALSTSDVIPGDLVRQALRQDTQPAVPPLAQARESFEREYLIRLLKLTEGNVSRAAKLAGRNRTEFYRLLGRHELRAADFKPAKGGS
ncbi:sigma 54-interacting transcriptional regulator [Halorhodospira halochloris]|uniref:Sensory histidine kinase YfhA n=1 Tax=Halorhodospira halochloris TaxID=1052 RepID=A0A0X8X6D4_HALHR|nr:sigma 54-interacting transcriptional regulator [Halorhodospira halochloris]MBK1651082.1 two-component system response regulator GlrR [Halorhodospira halochloris]MCG5529441.1 sigma 54-interacting transcriptional regulator [Halorhodospira halochloris]MCG5547424.1 sigma 54-interacting transcriptional regulator [Halorhodospira halochloris]BAU56404.1 putative sensory histidine kinase YfhA [Halorhodospira halochloris]